MTHQIIEDKKTISKYVENKVYMALKGHGYKKNMPNFYLSKNNFSCLIDIQKPKCHTSYVEEFTLNWSIFVPMSCYFYGWTVPKKPSWSRCIVTNRVSDLKREKFDRWWRIQIPTTIKDLDIALTGLEEDIQDYAVKFFSHINSLEDVIDMLESTKTNCGFHGFFPRQNNPEVSQALIYLFMNEKDKSLELMDKVILETGSTLYKENMQSLKTKIMNFDPTLYN